MMPSSWNAVIDATAEPLRGAVEALVGLPAGPGGAMEAREPSVGFVTTEQASDDVDW